MSSNTPVPIGTKQEAFITPKEGYEVDSVVVINTATNETVASSLKKVSDTPAQWICSFTQPAGSVVIRPSVKPILYSVTIEECDYCNIVLMEQSNEASVEIEKAAESAKNDGSYEPTEGATNFNFPQHSVNDGAEEALDVEDMKDEVVDAEVSEKCGEEKVDTVSEGETKASVHEDTDTNIDEPNNSETSSDSVNTPDDFGVESEIVEDNATDVNEIDVNDAPKDEESSEDGVEETDVDEQVAIEVQESQEETLVKTSSDFSVSNETEDDDEDSGLDNTPQATDQAYDATEFKDELEPEEPIYVSQAAHNKKNETYIKWRTAHKAGKCSAEDWEKVHQKHMSYLDKISSGKIIVR